MRVMWSRTSEQRQVGRLPALAAAVAFASAPSLAGAGVYPAGDHFTGNLSPGTNALFKMGSTALATCSQSSFSGSVLAPPANQGAPILVITPPTFNNGGTAPCTGATVTTSSANGAWTLTVSGTGPGGVVTLTIPKSGISVVRSLLGTTCTSLVAPTAATQVVGTWQPTMNGSKPRLIFTNVSMPVQTSGGGLCPSGTSMVFSASYDITDTTSSPPTQITIGSP